MAMDNPVYTMRGVQDELQVFADRVTITPKGVLGFLNKGMKGTKSVPFSSIMAIQFREAGVLFSGYLQLTLPGGVESARGIFQATKDENTFMFAHQKNNALAIEIKTYIDERIRNTSHDRPKTPSISSELQDLTALHAQGALTDAEFSAAKSRILGHER